MKGVQLKNTFQNTADQLMEKHLYCKLITAPLDMSLDMSELLHPAPRSSTTCSRLIVHVFIRKHQSNSRIKSSRSSSHDVRHFHLQSPCDLGVAGFIFTGEGLHLINCCSCEVTTQMKTPYVTSMANHESLLPISNFCLEWIPKVKGQANQSSNHRRIDNTNVPNR